MQIPSLENVQVDNLPDECREPWDLMIRQWSQKLGGFGRFLGD